MIEFQQQFHSNRALTPLQAHNGSLFPAAVVTFYCTYLCYSSMISEPHDYVCNGLGNRLDAASASTLAAGMFLALLSVVYSAMRAGSNTALFGFGEASGSESGEAMESLMEAQEGDLTSAGLDGEAEAKRLPGRGEKLDPLSFAVGCHTCSIELRMHVFSAWLDRDTT